MLRGKIALITGASRGIGRAIAEIFAQNGAELFLNARNSDLLREVCAEMASAYAVPVTPLPYDVSRPEEVRAGFQEIFRFRKHIDILVNNAGIMQDALLGMITPAVMEDVFRTNVFGTLFCSQYAARMMAKRSGGSIINMSSVVGVCGNEGQAVYSGSKAAIIGITKSLAKELAADNIRVNAIAPGFIDSEMTRTVPRQKYDERMQSIKMGRIGAPRDVAGCALYLASDLSSYTTGQVIGVDGGMLI